MYKHQTQSRNEEKQLTNDHDAHPELWAKKLAATCSSVSPINMHKHHTQSRNAQKHVTNDHDAHPELWAKKLAATCSSESASIHHGLAAGHTPQQPSPALS